MILGVGLDVVEVSRIAALYDRHGDAFARRITLPGEVQPRPRETIAMHLAGLFAAKEAVLKALGTGWAQGLSFAQVEVTREPGGRPGVLLHRAAAAQASRLGVARILLSITHERTVAVAVAVLESAWPEAAHGPLPPA